MAKQGTAALLIWCKNKTSGYPNVNVQNFHTSWRDGLDAIRFDSLSAANELHNNQLAFDTARTLGVPSLLDAEDMLVDPRPEMYLVFEKGTKRSDAALDVVNQEKSVNLLSPSPVPSNTRAPPTRQPTVGRGTPSAPNCAQCCKPLNGNTVEWSTSIYHERCFVCVGCSLPIKTSCIKVNNKPHCETCGKKAFIKTRVGGVSASEALRAAKTAEPASQPSSEPLPRSSTAPASRLHPGSNAAPAKKPLPAVALKAQPQPAASNLPASAAVHQTPAVSAASQNRSTPSTPTPMVNPSSLERKPAAPHHVAAHPTTASNAPSPSTSASSTVPTNPYKVTLRPTSEPRRPSRATATTDSSTVQTLPMPAKPKPLPAIAVQSNSTSPSPSPAAPSKSVERLKCKKCSYEFTSSPGITFCLNCAAPLSQLEAIDANPSAARSSLSPRDSPATSPRNGDSFISLKLNPKPLPKPAAPSSSSPALGASSSPSASAADSVASQPSASAPALPSSRLSVTLAPPPRPQAPLPSKVERESQRQEEYPNNLNPFSDVSDTPLKASTVPSLNVSLSNEFESPRGEIDSPRTRRRLQRGDNVLSTDESRRRVGSAAIPKDADTSFPPRKLSHQPPRPKHTRYSSDSTLSSPPVGGGPADSTAIFFLQIQLTLDLSAEDLQELTRSTALVTKFNIDTYHNTQLFGWLKKKDMKSTLGISGWKRRWFSLQESRLLYYPEQPERFAMGKDSLPDYPPEGIISLQFSISISRVGRKAVKIQLPERTYELEAEDSDERDRWVTGLERAKDIHSKLEQHTGVFSNNFGITKDDMRREGPMQVKNSLNTWKDRYLILVDGMLLVFASKSGSRKTKFPLFNCKMVPLIVSSGDRYGFKLELNDELNQLKEEISISCLDEIETQMWLNAILKQKIMIEEAINLITF